MVFGILIVGVDAKTGERHAPSETERCAAHLNLSLVGKKRLLL